MRALGPSDFLLLWERGRPLHPLDRSLLAVHAAFPEVSYDAAAGWPIGRRNQALAALRTAAFGPGIGGWTDCPDCGEKLEFAIDGSTLAESAVEATGEPIIVDGQAFRLPTSRDLAGIASEEDPARAAHRLVERCRLDGPAAHEPDLDAIGAEMALADPLADITLQFDCPRCGTAFEESLDLGDFLWAEIEAKAKRLLVEIDTIAAAYGWSEPEILALSPARRALYLEMVCR